MRWSTQLAGAVKSAPAYHGGTLYVGDYGGDMNAVDAKTGKLKWQSGSLGPGLRRHGRVLLDPAVAFGRVYAGNNDSRVYSFDLSDGELAWSYSTGGYVYSGPVVAKTTHTGPTVYIGSFDGNIYALNAKTGEPRWIQSGGRLGDRLADGDRQHRLRGRVHQRLDRRLRDEDRPPGLPLQDRHLHADRSPTGAASTSSATRASTRCSLQVEAARAGRARASPRGRSGRRPASADEYRGAAATADQAPRSEHLQGHPRGRAARNRVRVKL